MKRTYTNFLRPRQFPTAWCPGCGNGVVVKALAEAMGALGLNRNEVVLIGGIGCSGRTSFVMDVNTMHVTHGRVLAFAAGIKMVRPELTILGAMGDGDASAIGGNHLVHACRRNIDITAIVFNNGTYGQTGGQVAPTTPVRKRGRTALSGTIEPPFDLVELTRGAGAGFIARTSAFDYRHMVKHFRLAIEHKGFSFVDVLTMCPTYFGRMNDLAQPYNVLEYIRDSTTLPGHTRPPDAAPSLPLGIFCDTTRPSYDELYAQHCIELQQDSAHAAINAGNGQLQSNGSPHGRSP